MSKRIDINVRSHPRKLKSGKTTNVKAHTRNIKMTSKERIKRLNLEERKGQYAKEKLTGDLIRSNESKDTATMKTILYDKTGQIVGFGDRTYGFQANSGLTIKKVKKMLP